MVSELVRYNLCYFNYTDMPVRVISKVFNIDITMVFILIFIFRLASNAIVTKGFTKYLNTWTSILIFVIRLCFLVPILIY